MAVQGDWNNVPRRGWRRAALLLLLVPYIGMLWVSSYTSVAPEIDGIPFFYWYQFLWIAIGAAITIVVYVTDRAPHDEADSISRGREP